ncbi:Uncharacterised protein [Shigella sonnei]|nr:Uncharacterised protein [Shigella sonnei]
MRNSEELKIVTPSCSGRIASASMTRATSLASMDFQLPGSKRNSGAKSVSFIRCLLRSPSNIDGRAMVNFGQFWAINASSISPLTRL